MTGFAAYRRLARIVLVAVAAVGLQSGPAGAQSIDTIAKQAILVDANTNTVLFEKEADAPMYPASMSKLMTMAVLFDALGRGEVSLDDEFYVSEYAWRTGGAASGGSTMFAELNDTIRVEDLMRGVIVQSGNDASIVIAENMAGTEGAFAERMTQFGRTIGLENSRFLNATGLHDPDHVMTARDLARLAIHVIESYPDYYPIYSEEEFTWNGIRQFNRNPLLKMGIGADGLKTGYTKEAGYGLVGSAVQGDQRLVVVLNGLERLNQRGPEARKLLTWGFRAFESVALFDADEEVGRATVYGGDLRRLPLDGGGKPVTMLRPRGDAGRLRANIVYDGPLIPPIARGDRVATLQVESDDTVIVEAPLYAAVDVGRGPLWRRALDSAYELVAGLWYRQ